MFAMAQMRHLLIQARFLVLRSTQAVFGEPVALESCIRKT